MFMEENMFSQIDFGPVEKYLVNDDVTDLSYSNGGQLWVKTLSKGIYREEDPAVNNAFMEKEVLYVAPMVDIIEVEVEKGFAVSNPESMPYGNPW